MSFDVLRHLHKLNGTLVLAHQQIAHVRAESCDEMMGVKPARDNPVQYDQRFCDVTLLDGIEHIKIRLLVKNMEVLSYRLVGQIRSRKSHQLIKNTQGIPQSTIRFDGHYMQCCLLRFNALLPADALEMLHHIWDGNPVEIKNLTP